MKCQFISKGRCVDSDSLRLRLDVSRCVRDNVRGDERVNLQLLEQLLEQVNGQIDTFPGL